MNARMNVRASVAISIGVLMCGGAAGCDGNGVPSDRDEPHALITADSNSEPPPDLSSFQAPIPEGFGATPDLCAEKDNLTSIAGQATVSADGEEVRIDYENSRDQKFGLTLRGGDPAVLREEVRDLRVCLEAQAVAHAEGESTSHALLEDILLEAVAKVAGTTLESLASKRDTYVDNYSPTLADLIDEESLEEVKSEAAGHARSEFPSLGQPAIADAIQRLLAQPDAPFLVGASELPTEDRDYNALANERDVVILEVGVIDSNIDLGVDEDLAISYYIDPNVNRVALPIRRYYRAKCRQFSANVGLHAQRGRMSSVFWKTPP
ncbi:MAG: hypothetical protein ACJ73J_05790, partial [Actinomycetes bacterium]